MLYTVWTWTSRQLAQLSTKTGSMSQPQPCASIVPLCFPSLCWVPTLSFCVCVCVFVSFLYCLSFTSTPAIHQLITSPIHQPPLFSNSFARSVYYCGSSRLLPVIRYIPTTILIVYFFSFLPCNKCLHLSLLPTQVTYLSFCLPVLQSDPPRFTSVF